MRALVIVFAIGCSSPKPWPVPTSWRHERIPFPLDFAPSLTHTGVEEIRFAPGFFDPAAPGYWAYAFVWRLEDKLEASAVAGELTTYFRGLVAAVDDKISDRESITVRAGADGSLTAHVIDAFTTKKPIDLAGTAKRIACARGELWVFTFAPVGSPMRAEVDAVAATAACNQPTLENKQKS